MSFYLSSLRCTPNTGSELPGYVTPCVSWSSTRETEPVGDTGLEIHCGADCVCVLSHVLLFCDPMDCKPSGFSVHGIFQARILEGIAISFPTGSFQHRDQTHVSCISCIDRWIIYHLRHLETNRKGQNLKERLEYSGIEQSCCSQWKFLLQGGLSSSLKAPEWIGSDPPRLSRIISFTKVNWSHLSHMYRVLS